MKIHKFKFKGALYQTPLFYSFLYPILHIFILSFISSFFHTKCKEKYNKHSKKGAVYERKKLDAYQEKYADSILDYCGEIIEKVKELKRGEGNIECILEEIEEKARKIGIFTEEIEEQENKHGNKTY